LTLDADIGLSIHIENLHRSTIVRPQAAFTARYLIKNENDLEQSFSSNIAVQIVFHALLPSVIISYGSGICCIFRDRPWVDFSSL